jgi:hypothetical protein
MEISKWKKRFEHMSTERLRINYNCIGGLTYWLVDEFKGLSGVRDLIEQELQARESKERTV